MRQNGKLNVVGKVASEVASVAQHEDREGDRKEAAELVVDGHDPTLAVLDEIFAVQVGLAEAQTVGFDLVAEVDTTFSLSFPCAFQDLCRELSSQSNGSAKRERTQRKCLPH